MNKVPGKRPIKKVAKKAPKKIIKKRPVKKVPKKKIPPRPKTTKKTTTTTTTTTTEETTTVPPTTTESIVEEQREVVAIEDFGEGKGWNTFNEYPNNYNNNQVQNVDQYSTEVRKQNVTGNLSDSRTHRDTRPEIRILWWKPKASRRFVLISTLL